MSTPTVDPTTPLSRAPLELAIAMDEWRRSRANDELIWSSGTLRVLLTDSVAPFRLTPPVVVVLHASTLSRSARHVTRAPMTS